MIYQFPDLNTLLMALTSGTIPPEVSITHAAVEHLEGGRIQVQPSVPLSRKALIGLKKLGVEWVKDEHDLPEQVTCWSQMVPLVREPSLPVPTPTTPVLFELPSGDLLPDLVAEMLRLGNDRQSFRFIKDDAGNRVLLRVVGPPYYSLLRALDRDVQGSGPIAYLELAPQVWVEVGYTHPLMAKFRPGTGQMLLMRPPQTWKFLTDAPFQDIYEILDFTLPAAAVSWKETKSRQRLKVPLRLGPSSSTEKAELWVLREKAVDRLDALVRDSSEEHLIHRLLFAVFEQDGEPVVVLRVRPSKQAPPVVVLENAQAFRPYAKMPNLFLPCGRELRPALRRDMVRQLLASDPDQVTWLWPGDEASFVPEGVPEAAFRPLSDWVDYVLDRDRAALLTWIQAATFDFQAYVCGEEDRPESPKPPPRERKGSRGNRDDLPPEADEPPVAPTAAKKTRRREAADEFALPQEKPSELKVRLTALENQFIDHDGPLDAEERQSLWPEMARLNTALNHGPDAAVCWLNALWEADTPPAEWAGLWLRAEQMAPSDVDGAIIDRLLALDDPTVGDVRLLVACILGATAFGTGAELLGPRLARLQQFLEKYEGRVGIRAAWMAWLNLARLSAGDVLALARARDRLLERLLTRGLEPEQDLPTFLRYAGQKSSERFRAVREHVFRLRDLALHWIDHCYSLADNPEVKSAHAFTRAYADLIFAYGLARLGETSGARRLQAASAEVLSKRDDIHAFLLRAYTYRIQQVLEGKFHGGPLPEELQECLSQITHKKDSAGRVVHLDAYKIDQLRLHSRILEPQERVDPLRHLLARSELSKDLLAIAELDDRQEMAQRLGKLLQGKKHVDEQLEIFKTSLSLAPRISEAFTLDILAQLTRALDAIGEVQNQNDLEMRAALLERALFLAAHFDRSELVQAFVGRFLRLVESQRGEDSARALDALTGQCFRGLRKLGLRDEIDRLLQQMATLVMEGKSLAALRGQHKKNWPAVLRILLQIAAGWLFFERREKAMPILLEADDFLYSGELVSGGLTPEQTKLACAYATALGQAQVDIALHKLAELFQKLSPLLDLFVTKSHYSRAQLQVVEAVVLAVVSDDFTLSHGARRWLDEDEYLVRRRIHRDLRSLMTQSGL